MYDSSHRGLAMAPTLTYARGKGWLAQSKCCAASRARREQAAQFSPSRREALAAKKRAHRALLEKHIAFMAAMQAKQQQQQQEAAALPLLLLKDAPETPVAVAVAVAVAVLDDGLPAVPQLQDVDVVVATPLVDDAAAKPEEPAGESAVSPTVVADATTPQTPAPRSWTLMDYLLPWRWL